MGTGVLIRVSQGDSNISQGGFTVSQAHQRSQDGCPSDTKPAPKEGAGTGKQEPATIQKLIVKLHPGSKPEVSPKFPKNKMEFVSYPDIHEDAG